MNRIFALLHAALGLLLALTPFVLWPVCDRLTPDGGHMACYYSGLMAVCLGASVVALDALYVLSRSRAARLVSCVVALVVPALMHALAIGALRISGDGWAIGLCGMDTMACRAVTVPHAIWISIGMCLLSAFWSVWSMVAGDR